MVSGAKRVPLALSVLLLLCACCGAAAEEQAAMCGRSGGPPDPQACAACPMACGCQCMASGACALGGAQATAFGAQAAPAEDTGPAVAEEVAAARRREEAQKWVRLLAGPGWRQAEAELVKMGAVAVPLLIEALPPSAGADQPAYAVRAPGKATRPMALAEVVHRVLCNLFQNHSSYQGALPALDRKAWEEFWAREGAGIQFGKQ